MRYPIKNLMNNTRGHPLTPLWGGELFLARVGGRLPANPRRGFFPPSPRKGGWGMDLEPELTQSVTANKMSFCDCGKYHG